MLTNVFSNFANWDSDCIGFIKTVDLPDLSLDALLPIANERYQACYGVDTDLPAGTGYQFMPNCAMLQELLQEEEMNYYVDGEFTHMLVCQLPTHTKLLIGLIVM